MNGFKNKLQNLSPEHDTPVGLIHPYWARKPLNVIQELVSYFSAEGDLVVDPFVGSGTTVFAALSQNRRVFASDINPLAIFLTTSIIELCFSPERKLEAINHFLEDFKQEVLPWFHYRENLYVERERFDVEGDYENGSFNLVSSEVVLKTFNGDVFKGRVVETPSPDWLKKTVPRFLCSSPLNFRKLKLLPNSRIAIPDGATFSHYFDAKNQAAINLALKLIASGNYGVENANALRLLLSASLPLLRLSDKKASSQWPYWRPKQNLTSRNPILVLQNKLKAVKHAIEWLQENISEHERGNLSEHVHLHNVSVQSLVPEHIVRESVDLVVTDPPYADQAPYLEYSALWIQILGLGLPIDAYRHEIVKTDAPRRKRDDQEYVSRLRSGLRTCSSIIKPNGVLIWFYQDHSVPHWAVLDEEAIKNNLVILEVVPMPKQRRSMKTVTSPGKTLDGDLILVFKKDEHHNGIPDYSSQAHQLLSDAQSQLPSSASYFDQYASIIEVSLKHHLMGCLAQSFVDIREILEKVRSGR